MKDAWDGYWSRRRSIEQDRDAICRELGRARGAGFGYETLASGLLPPTGDPAQTNHQRRALARSLKERYRRCRVRRVEITTIEVE